MAGSIKIQNKHQIPVNLDADKLEDFKKAIGMPIGEYIRRHQSDVVEEYRKDLKALYPQKVSFLSSQPEDKQKQEFNISSSNLETVTIQNHPVLEFMKLSKSAVIEGIDMIDNKQELGKFQGNSKLGLKVSETRMKRL